MSITTDIVQSWLRPAPVFERLLGHGVREDRVLAYMMFGCLLIFIGQLPRLARISHLDNVPLEQLVAYEFVSWLIIWPFAFYVIAGLTRLAAKLFGGKGSFFSARLALFWAILASAPALLFHGLVAAFIGTGAALTVAGLLWLGLFARIWLTGMLLTEKSDSGVPR